MSWSPLQVSRLVSVLAFSSFAVMACAEAGRGSTVDDDSGESQQAQETTTAATSTGSGAPGECTVSALEFNEPVCGECVDNNCCATLQQCDGSAECVDFIGCLQGCTDTFCEDTCYTSYPTGSTYFLDLDSCMNTGCADSCGG